MGLLSIFVQEGVSYRLFFLRFSGPFISLFYGGIVFFHIGATMYAASFTGLPCNPRMLKAETNQDMGLYFFVSKGGNYRFFPKVFWPFQNLLVFGPRSTCQFWQLFHFVSLALFRVHVAFRILTTMYFYGEFFTYADWRVPASLDLMRPYALGAMLGQAWPNK